MDKKCQGNGLLQKIDTLTSSIEEKNQETSGIIIWNIKQNWKYWQLILTIMSWITVTAHKYQLESKIDSTLSKVEGLMAKSGDIENRFDEIDHIHQEIKGSMIKSNKI